MKPLMGYNFAVRLIGAGSGLLTAGFSECSGLESTLEVEEYKEGGNNSTVLKFPTRASAAPIRLKRGVVLTDELWDWHLDFLLGKGKRRNGQIILQSEEGQPLKTWLFHRGIPTKYTGPSFNALQGEVAVEEVEITHEGLLLLKAGSLLQTVQVG